MPHITLEYSQNIKEKGNFLPLFEVIHRLLAEKLPTTLASCKSRAIEHSLYMVGDGGEDNAFVHLAVRVMPGRSEEVLRGVGDAILSTLKEYFQQSAREQKLQITLEVGELGQLYYKFVSP